ncbi:MAG: BTAD domain-containing putative transcriptional regulator [Gaiellaceae bacterium]
MEFRILGRLDVLDQGRVIEVGSGKQRALLAVLLIHPNQLLQIDQLSEELWGVDPPDSAVKTIQVLVSRLRKALGEPGRIETGGSGYRLRVEPGELDADRAQSLLDEGRAREALDLWRGDSLEEFRYEAFAANEAARLDELRQAATEARIDADLELGRHSELVAELEALVAVHPLRERLWAQRMTALYRSGRQADALAAYEELRRSLDQELGLTPGPALQKLQQSILRQDSGLAPLRPAGGANSFVGREREFGELRAAFAATRAGSGGLVLVEGEAGIGKTRLTDEFARAITHHGARVVWGRCWEAGGAPAYWPWVQAFRTLLRNADETTIQGWLGAGGPELANLLPELRELFPALPEPSALDSEGARFRLFDRTASFLGNATNGEPLVFVLDDLCVADVPSVLLLEFLAANLADKPILFVAAYRNDNPSAALVALGRLASSRIALRGLTRPEVASFIRLSAAIQPDDRVVSAITAASEGNPLFVSELVRLVDIRGSDVSWRHALPHGIRNVIDRRLDALSSDCVALLEQASIFGRELPLAALAKLTGAPSGELQDTLIEAERARVLAEAPEGPASLRFSHTLVRDALYERIPPSRRAERHRAAGGALAELYVDDPEPHLTELAHHFSLGAAAGDTDHAVTYGRLAAARATRLLAHEESARLYERTIQVLDSFPPVDQALRSEILLELGESHSRAGDVPAAKATFLEAARIADRAELTETFARAAIGYGGPFMLLKTGDDADLKPLLERALDRLPPGNDVLRSRLLARLAGALRAHPTPPRAVSLSNEAVALARATGDRAAIACALEANFTALWTSLDSIDDWLAAADEVVTLAEAAGDAECAFNGRNHRFGTLMHLGDVAGADRELAAMVATAEELRQPAQLWFAAVAQAMRATFGGDYARAEDRIFAARAQAKLKGIWDATSMYVIQLYTLRKEQGRLTEVAAELEAYLRREPGRALYRSMLVDLYVGLGRVAEARTLLAEHAAPGLANIERDNEWIFGAALLSEDCRALADAETAGELYELLLPHEGQNVTSYPEVTTGAVSRYLALLAETCGRPDEAARHYENALQQNERMGAWPALAHTQHDYGSFLLTRGESSAQELLASAVTSARALGVAAL